MSLTQMTAHLFDKNVRARGQNIYATRRVYVRSAGFDHFYAQVQGGDLYDVRIDKSELGLEVWCECIAFEDHGPCKHLWTAILEADRRGALAAVKQVLYLQRSEDSPTGGMATFLTPPQPAPPPMPAWQEYLGDVERALKAATVQRRNRPKPGEILYSVDVSATRSKGQIVLELFSRSRKKDGQLTAPKEFHISAEQAALLPDPIDVEAISALFGGQDIFSYSSYASGITRKTLSRPLAQKLLPLLSSAGRLCCRDYIAGHLDPIVWDAGDSWIPWLELRQDERDQWTIAGFLRRGAERMELDEPLFLVDDGLMLARGAVSRFEPGGNFGWVSQLREVKRIPFPDRERDAVLAKLLQLPALPPMEVDEALRFEERKQAPRLGLRIRQERKEAAHSGLRMREERAQISPRYVAQFMLDYGAGWMDGMSEGRGVWRAQERVFLARDKEAEDAAREKLSDLGLRTDAYRPDFWIVNTRSLPRVARELIGAGWHVEAEGKLFRAPGATRVSVKSGIDWFELHGEVEYGDTTASLPALLAAVRRGDSMVVLGDGTFGLLPEEWLQRFAPLAGMGEKAEDHLKFRHNQAALLDALLAAQTDLDVDETFARIRERVRTFHGVEAAAQPKGFVGQLREYQLEGLGWMQFLREFGFGGCLADDMGVGKTAQVLATLEGRRAEGKGPSLVVVPKSVMFNWREESTRFTPQLRVLEYHGTARDAGEIPRHDLVLTTYGTMLPRRAHAIENRLRLCRARRGAGSEERFHGFRQGGAPAARRPSAGAQRHARGKSFGRAVEPVRIPQSGNAGRSAPVANVGRPGAQSQPGSPRVAGAGAAAFHFAAHQAAGGARTAGEDRADHFLRARGPAEEALRGTAPPLSRCRCWNACSTKGWRKSKMHVLEALLRLRQAACHPGLIDPKRVDEPSAKLDVLMAQLAEVREEGHKALVFSQFTSLLAIVRRRLDQENVRYEYLDGATTIARRTWRRFRTMRNAACF